MKKKERVAIYAPVFFIQFPDSRLSQLQQRIVFRQRFRACILKIGQQAEAQVVVTVGQEPDFQRFDQIFDVLSTAEHRRNHH